MKLQRNLHNNNLKETWTLSEVISSFEIAGKSKAWVLFGAAFQSKRNNSHVFAGEDTAYEKQKHIQK